MNASLLSRGHERAFRLLTLWCLRPKDGGPSYCSGEGFKRLFVVYHAHRRLITRPENEHLIGYVALNVNILLYINPSSEIYSL